MLALLTNKWIAYAVEVLIAAALVAGATIWIMVLCEKAGAYDALRAEVHALETRYGCDRRDIGERDLPTCLVARELDAAAARERIERLAAAERAKAATLQRRLDERMAATERAIDESTAADGPVPAIMIEQWARERQARGMR